MKLRNNFIITCFLLILFYSHLYGEFVFLKDGRIIEGKVVSDSSDYIILKTGSGKEQRLDRSLITRTLYTNLNMSKLYVQKRNGDSFVAFLVDEDRDEYRFRKELYKPEEFSVPRKDILFMSEKNPSALKGEPSSESIRLSWLPPYGQVKVYRIYIKQKKSDEYKMAGSTKKAEITISGLKSQTEYLFIVRAVDDTDYETNPSNEIKVTTKSILPNRPDVTVSRDEKNNWVLIWNEASDSDGKVEGYRIYLENDGKYSLIKETKKNTGIVPYSAIFDSVHVRSVDNNGDESEPEDYRNDWRFIVSPLYALPAGEMKTFAGNGYGAALDISRRDILFNDLELGIGGSWAGVEGKKDIGGGNSSVKSLDIFSGGMFLAYRIPLNFDRFSHYDIISVFPKFSAGVTALRFGYDMLDNTGAVDEKKSNIVIDPFVKGGLFVEVGLSRNFFFTVGGEYMYLVDSVKGLGMVIISASAGLRF